MRSLLELASILSMLVSLGALCWLGLVVIGSSVEVGDGSLMSWDKAAGPLWIAGLAIVVNLGAGALRKRMDR